MKADAYEWLRGVLLDHEIDSAANPPWLYDLVPDEDRGDRFKIHDVIYAQRDVPSRSEPVAHVNVVLAIDPDELYGVSFWVETPAGRTRYSITQESALYLRDVLTGLFDEMAARTGRSIPPRPEG